MPGSRSRATAVAALAAAALALLLAHHPHAGLADHPQDPTSLDVAAAAWVAWALGGYLLVGVVVAAAGRAHPRLPRWTRRAAPRPVRRWVDAMVGASAVAVSVTVAPSVAAAATPPRPPAVTAGVDAVPSVPSLDWPGLAPPSPSPSPSPAPTRSLVVRRGDSLWSLTARLLGSATDEQVATEWPRLYAANRAVIGPDPALIRPGQRLVPPSPDPRSSS